MARGKKKRRRVRGLVVGHLERVSGDVFDNRSGAITELAGNRPGIYALYKNNALYYVGLARKLRLKGRVKSHLRDRHAGKWNYFSMYFIRGERYLRELESLAIRIAYPKGNKARGKFGGAPDLRKMLRKKMLYIAREEVDVLMGRIARPVNGELVSRSISARKARKMRRKEEDSHVPVLRGLLTDKALQMRYKGKTYRAWINRSGRIRLVHTGEVFDSPSSAAKAIRKLASNGWYWWKFKNNEGEWHRLQELRHNR
jgi:hypothetical protein